jgi:hypothetical protein
MTQPANDLGNTGQKFSFLFANLSHLDNVPFLVRKDMLLFSAT